MELFKTVKTIKSKDGVLHFKRFAIFEGLLFSIYIHYIYKEDKDPLLHDHPWNYFNLILKGSYTEEFYGGEQIVSPGFYSYQNANRFHKIKHVNTDKVITLFITGKRFREWGYSYDNKWVHNQEYRKNKEKYSL